MIKALVGYDVDPSLTREQYDQWLWDIHVPDLRANPHLQDIVFNTVLEPVETTSGSTTEITQTVSLYRVAELHFEDLASYRRYRAWFDEHPIPAERSPAGRSDFRFYVVCDSIRA